MASTTTTTMSWKAALATQLNSRDARFATLCRLVGKHERIVSRYESLEREHQELAAEARLLREDKRALQNRLDAARTSSSSVAEGGGGGSEKELKALEKQVASLNDELLELHRKRNENRDGELELMRANKRLETRTSEQEKQLEESARVRKELTLEKEGLKKQVKRHAIELQTIMDEHVALQLAYNTSEKDLRQTKAENEELLSRWLQAKQEEADRQNRLNESAGQRKAANVAKDMLEASRELPDVGSGGGDSAGGAAAASAAAGFAYLPQRATRNFDAHPGEIFDVLFSTQGTRFATGAADKRLKLWDTTSGSLQGTLAGHAGSVTCVDFCNTDDRALSGGSDKAMFIWNLKTQRSVHKLTGHSEKIHAARFSADSQKIFSASQDRTIKVWCARRGFFENSYLTASTCLDLVPGISGSLIFSAHFDRSIKEFDVRSSTRKPTREMNTGQVAPVTALKLAPDGYTVLAASKDSTMAAIDIRTFEVIQRYEHANFAVGNHGCRPCFSPDGRYIASGTVSGGLVVFNSRTGALEKEINVGGHSQMVTATSWCPTGRQVVSVGKQGKVVIWTG